MAMARDLVRDDVVLQSNIWVVKVGTSVLAGPDGTLDPARIDHLAEQISAVVATGRRVALVSSGAVGAGIGRLGLRRRPDNLPQLQAAAAVGQAFLIRAYDEGLRRHGRHAAQLLLTHEDFDSRPRYLNMRNTLTALFEYDAVPVINENDTISVDEIKFGDNDRLAAMVTNLLRAPLAGDPQRRRRPLPRRPRAVGGEGEVIPLVANLDDDVLGLAGDSRSALGTGGMRSKLQAARLVTQAGGSVIIASGKKAEPLTRILAGEAGRHPVPRPGGDPGGPQALDRPDRPAPRPLRRRRRRPPRAGGRARTACSPSASSRSSATSRRATSSASATPTATSSPAACPTTPPPTPARSAASAPNRPATPSADAFTTRSSTRTTSS